MRTLGLALAAVSLVALVGCDAPGFSRTTTTGASVDKDQPSEAAWLRMGARGRKHGVVERQAVESAVRRELEGPVAACYRAALRRDPHARGNVRILMIIEESGDVSDVADDRSTFKDRQMVACVARALKSVHVSPPPTGGIVEITSPFTFVPAASPPKST